MNINDLFQGRIKIQKPSPDIYKAVKQSWDSVAKPLDSLGLFESIICRIGAIQDTERPSVSRRAILVMCADNGVVAEGVSQCGQEVTLAVARSMGRNASSVGRMGKRCGVDVICADVGINSVELVPGIRNMKVARGTKNFATEPAMSKEEALKAMDAGFQLALECKEKGYDIIGIGEMGIGNTTTSSAIAASLLGKDAAEITGRGAGLSDSGLDKKITVINNAIGKYDLYNAPPLEVLCCVGGFDIAAMAGAILGAACSHMPVILDGAISMAAALVAERLFPGTEDCMIASHISREPLARAVLSELDLRGIIDADMGLGEGSGAVMLFPLLDAAMAVFDEQTTFGDIEIEPYRRWNQ